MNRQLMDKQARVGLVSAVNGLGNLLGMTTSTAGTGLDALVRISNAGAAMLLATAIGGGAVIGAAAAKMTAHGKQDIDSVGLAYTNERLKADLAYTGEKLRSEWGQLQRRQAPKPARVLG